MTAEGPGLPLWQSRPRTEGRFLLVGTSRGQGAQGPVLPLGGGTSFGTVAVRLETSPSVLPHLTPLTPLVRVVWGWRTLTSESVSKNRNHGSEDQGTHYRVSLTLSLSFGGISDGLILVPQLEDFKVEISRREARGGRGGACLAPLLRAWGCSFTAW